MSLRHIVIALAVATVVLGSGLLVNACRLSKLLGRPTESDPSGSGTGTGGGAKHSIVVTPSQVIDSAIAGETVPHESNLDVSNGGTWVASTGSSWIRFNPARGGSRATIRLSLVPKDLTPGLHEGSLAVQEEQDSTGLVATVTVKFRIQQPILKVTPSSLSYTAHSSNAVFNDTLVVANTGDGPLVWHATTENHSRWLALTDTAGTGAGRIAVRASNAGLSYFGTFHETIIVTAPGAKNSPARIDVTIRRHKHDDDVTTP